MTKQKILKNALELFMEKGYDGASMSDIAAATGIRKASLYAHFSGKQDIFLAVFEDILAEYAVFLKSLTAEQAGESTTDQLERIFLAFITYCHGNAKMYFWDRYFYFPPAFITEYMLEKTQGTQTQFLDGIIRCIQQGIDRGEIRSQPAQDAALAYYYLMIGISMSVKLYDKEALMRDVQAAWGSLRLGLMKDIQ